VVARSARSLPHRSVCNTPSQSVQSDLATVRAGASRVMNPVVLAILFFGVLMPIGVILRLAEKDPLRLRIDKSVTSYWIERSVPGTSMTKQY